MQTTVKKIGNVRVNLALKAQDYTDAKQLQYDTCSPSLTETLRRAIKIYRKIHDLSESGGSVIFKTGDGERKVELL